MTNGNTTTTEYLISGRDSGGEWYQEEVVEAGSPEEALREAAGWIAGQLGGCPDYADGGDWEIVITATPWDDEDGGWSCTPWIDGGEVRLRGQETCAGIIAALS